MFLVSVFFISISLKNILEERLYRVPIFIDYKKDNTSYLVSLILGLVFAYYSLKKIFKEC